MDSGKIWVGGLATLVAGLSVLGCGDSAGAGVPPEPASGRFTMLAYNVAGLPEQLSSEEPSINMPFIGPLLNDYELVLVQESWLMDPNHPLAAVYEVYHHILMEHSEHPYQSEPMPLPWRDPIRPSAFVSDGLNRFSDFPFGEVTRVMWEGCFGGLGNDRGAGDCLAMKGFSVAAHELAPGAIVHVYNLHGEAGATELDQTLQEDGFAMLTEFINDHSAGFPIILGGDTNLHTHSGHSDGWGDRDLIVWESLLEGTGLVDVCDVVDPCERGIDKVAFRSHGALVFEALSQLYDRERFVRDDGTRLSDHPPVVVEFEWDFDPER